MNRFYLPPEHCKGDLLVLSEREAHHAAGVLRLRVGEPAGVLDGQGQMLECTVAEISRRRTVLEVRKRSLAAPPPASLTLFQAVPKGKTMDWIVQQATELGVNRIVPVLSERVNVRYDDSEADAKRDKWRQTSVEAIKQCGQPWLPCIERPESLRALLNAAEPFDLSLIAALHPSSRHPRHWFDACRAAHSREPRRVAVWIGPEGDFTPDELENIQSAGARMISLGDRVLRAETAALYALSVTRYELDWQPQTGRPLAKD